MISFPDRSYRSKSQTPFLFKVRPSDILQSIKGLCMHVIGCINRDIVAGLCSELFLRLSNYIGYGKKLSFHTGDLTAVLKIVSGLLSPLLEH